MERGAGELRLAFGSPRLANGGPEARQTGHDSASSPGPWLPGTLHFVRHLRLTGHPVPGGDPAMGPGHGTVCLAGVPGDAAPPGTASERAPREPDGGPPRRPGQALNSDTAGPRFATGQGPPLSLGRRSWLAGDGGIKSGPGQARADIWRAPTMLRAAPARVEGPCSAVYYAPQKSWAGGNGRGRDPDGTQPDHRHRSSTLKAERPASCGPAGATPSSTPRGE